MKAALSRPDTSEMKWKKGKKASFCGEVIPKKKGG